MKTTVLQTFPQNLLNGSRRVNKQQILHKNIPTHPALYLQHTLGNQAVLRMLKSGALQTKLPAIKGSDSATFSDNQTRRKKGNIDNGHHSITSFTNIATGNGYDRLVQMQPVMSAAGFLLTNDKIRSAIRYNRFMYPPAQLRLLQKALHITETGRSDENTAIAVAQYQHIQGLTIDGKAGPATFAMIQADTSITGKEDLLLFSVNVREGIMLTTGGGTTDMLGHFNVEIHLPPGNCEDYEYRQYICGEVDFLPANATPTTPFTSLNNLFTTQPGGSLPHIPNFHQDGNTTLNAQYGHRKKPALPENKYVDGAGNIDQRHGCTFLGEDFPGINGRITHQGEIYDFDLRFLGEVRHKARGRIAERWWNIRSTFGI